MHGTAKVAEGAFGLVGLVSHALSGSHEPDVDLAAAPVAVAPAPAAPAAPPSPPSAPPEASPSPAALDVETPDHVSEEARLVDSVADAGAEDGAGAQVNVAEPWDAYRQMKARDVIERIAGSSTAVLAAVQLYERSGRARQSILAAVDRELKRAGG